MKLVYHGPHDAVEFDLPDGTVGYAERDGAPVDLPAELARSFLEQPANWRPAPPEKKTDQKE